MTGEGEWFSSLSGVVAEEAIAVVARDVGAVIEKAAAPAEMAAGQSVEVEVTVGNAGPRTWVAADPESPDFTTLVCEWYYWDGQPCDGSAVRISLPRDVAPGEKIGVKAGLTAPPAAGMYWLVWRVEQPGAQAPAASWREDWLVQPVQVTGGPFQPIDLSPVANIVAVTEKTDVYISGYYAAAAGKRVPFSFPDTRGGVAGAVACQGQSISLGDAPAGAVYLLAASTQGARQVAFTLLSPEGEEEVGSLVVPDWTSFTLLSPEGEEEVGSLVVPDWTSPREGDQVGAYTPYLRGLTRDDVTAQGHLYVLELRPSRLQGVSALRLPKDAAVKVMAVTVERD